MTEFLMLWLSMINQAAYRRGVSKETLHKELEEACDATDRLKLGITGNATPADYLAKVVELNEKR